MTSRQAMILTAMSLAFFAGNLDITAMNLTIPYITTSLHTTIATAQWVLTGYLLGFSALMVAGGRLSDLVGHKRFFLLGLGIFIITSLLGGFAQHAWQLVACRVIQGVGAACLWPGIQAIVMQTFDEKTRGTAMGILLGFGAGLAMAVGPLVGGTLVQFLSWRYVLWINVIIGVVTFVIAALSVPVPQQKVSFKLDYPGLLLIGITFLALAYGFDLSGRIGFTSGQALLAFGCAIVGLLLFVWREMTCQDPLVDLAILKNGFFIGGIICRMAVMYSYVVVIFLLGLYFEHVMKLSPVTTGLYMMPMMITTAILSLLAGRLIPKFGDTRQMLFGVIIVAIGVWAFMQQRDIHITFWTNAIPSIIFGFGLGLCFPTSNVIALRSLPKNYTGLAAGMLYMMALLAGSIGISVSATIAKVRAWDLIQSNFLRLGVHMSTEQQQALQHAVNHLNLNEYLQAHYPAELLAKIHPSVDYVYGHSFADAGYVAIVFCIIAYAIMVITVMAQRKGQIHQQD